MQSTVKDNQRQGNKVREENEKTNTGTDLRKSFGRGQNRRDFRRRRGNGKPCDYRNSDGHAIKIKIKHEYMGGFFVGLEKYFRRDRQIPHNDSNFNNLRLGGKSVKNIRTVESVASNEQEKMFTNSLSRADRVDNFNAQNEFSNREFSKFSVGSPAECDNFIRRVADQFYHFYRGRHEKYISDVFVPDRREDTIRVANELFRNAKYFEPPGN